MRSSSWQGSMISSEIPSLHYKHWVLQLGKCPFSYLAFWLRVVCSLYTFASCVHFSAVKDTGPDASLAVFNTKPVMLPLNSWICVSRTVANKCINISILKTCGVQFNSYLWKIGWRIKRGDIIYFCSHSVFAVHFHKQWPIFLAARHELGAH